jgi:hypothetical protein
MTTHTLRLPHDLSFFSNAGPGELASSADDWLSSVRVDGMTPGSWTREPSSVFQRPDRLRESRQAERRTSWGSGRVPEELDGGGRSSDGGLLTGKEDYLRRDAGDSSSGLQYVRREDGARSPHQGPAVTMEAGGGRSGRRRGTLARRGHGRHSPTQQSPGVQSPQPYLSELIRQAYVAKTRRRHIV